MEHPDSTLSQPPQSVVPRSSPAPLSRALSRGPELAAVVGLLLTAASFAGSLHWWPDLFSHFRIQLAGVLAITALLLASRGKWTLGALSLGGVAAHAFFIVPHALPSIVHQRPAALGPTVRCLSFNVLQGNERFADGAAFLRASGADAAVFQEVTPEWADALASLRDVYPHQLLRGKKDSKGYALISKHPVRELRFDPLPSFPPIGAVLAQIDAPQPFTLLGIHSHKPTSALGALSQRAYFAWLAEKCAAEHAKGRPVVLMGDFNATPWCRALRDFSDYSSLLDTSRGVTFGATWNAWRPQRLMIDHGFVSPEWRLLSRQVGPDLGSDHRPLIIDLAVAR